jgi:hypothetical protein
MMPYDQWLGQIIEAAEDIASREYQEEAWFQGTWFQAGKIWSSPLEVYLTLMDDNTFDLFFETYGNRFTEQQIRAANELRSALEHYYEKLPDHPDPLQVLNDPEWESVRQTAKRFVQAFKDVQ